MWLFTTDGFYSAVTHREAPDTRRRSRPRSGGRRCGSSRPSARARWSRRRTATTGFRVCLPRATWAAYVAAAAEAIDYPNFKAAIAERQGADRAHVYGAVWAAMFAFQQRRALDRS